MPLGKKLEEADPDDPLITDTEIKLEITVGDVQRIAGACVKAFPPVVEIPPGARIKRKRWFDRTYRGLACAR